MKFSAHVKHQEIKGLVAVSFNSLQEVPAKFEMQYKAVIYFSFNFAYFIQLHVVY